MEYVMGIRPQGRLNGVLELRKLDFRGLKSQFDVKKANFRGLIAKINHDWPIRSLLAYFGY